MSNILSHLGKYKVIFYYNFKLFYIIKKFVKYTKLIKFIQEFNKEKEIRS